MIQPRAASPPAGRAEETRYRLLAAGRDAFARKGLAAVNLKKDVLDPAGISVGSFYHQFKDKRELLIAILEEHSAATRARFSEVHSPDGDRGPEQIARDSWTLLFDMADLYTEETRIQLREREASDPGIRAFIEQDRLRWQRSLTADYTRIAEAHGLDLEVELAAELVTFLTDGVLHHYVTIPRAERAKARERLLDGLVRLTLRGLPGLTPAHQHPQR